MSNSTIQNTIKALQQAKLEGSQIKYILDMYHRGFYGRQLMHIVCQNVYCFHHDSQQDEVISAIWKLPKP